MKNKKVYERNKNPNLSPRKKTSKLSTSNCPSCKQSTPYETSTTPSLRRTSSRLQLQPNLPNTPSYNLRKSRRRAFSPSPSNYLTQSHLFPLQRTPPKIQTRLYRTLLLTKMEAKRRTVRTLVSKLSSVSEPTRIDALCQLRQMSKLDPETRPVIAESGAIPYLAETLYSSSHPSQENAAATLLNLSITEKEPLMSTRGVLDAIAHVISHNGSTSSAAAVQSSAAVIHSLLSSVDEYRPVVGAKREIVYALIDILRCHVSSPPRTIKDALKALFGIALHPLNRATMVQFGVVPALFSLVLKDGRVGIVEDATAVIAQVAGCEDSAEAFWKVSGAGVLADLLDLATGASMRTKENAVSALLNLVRCGGEKVADDVRDVVAFGALDGIADVRNCGSGKGKSKATELLKLMLGSDSNSNSHSNGNDSVVLSSDNGSSFGSLRNHDSD
ncbi:hypothetical protein VNO77_39373 [Canavalia gladiata]|uniref:U-box domain-containing protein n=1 Tax=Canavalia gladiata TaxID=3824 RepID=A0AAN9KCI1_CANGL